MHKKIISAVVLLLTFIPALRAGTEISLDECASLARANYPAIKKLELIRVTADCDFSNASRSWLPSVRLGVWANWNSQASDINDLYSQAGSEAVREYYRNLFQSELNVLPSTPWVYGGGVEVSQRIYDGGVSSARKSEARAQAELRESEVNSSLEAVERKVEELYFSILLLTERDKQMSLQMEVLERSRKKLSDMEQSGAASTLSVKMIQAELISLSQQENTLRGNITAYRQSLSLLVGKDITSMPLHRMEIPDIPHKSIYDTSAMRMLDSRANLAKANMDVLSASLKPQVMLVGNVTYGYPGSNVFKSVVNHNPMPALTFGVKMAWDLTPFYTKKNNIQKIQNELRMLDFERESLLLNTRIDNAALNSHIAQITGILKQDEELLRLRTEIRQIEEARLESGDIDADTFLDKVSDESAAALSHSIHTIELLQYYYQSRSL